MRNLKNLIYLYLWTWIQQMAEINTTEDSNDFGVDKFINEYVSEVQRTLRIRTDQHVISKRSHPDVDFNKLSGIELLQGFQEVYTLPTKYPLDIILFFHCIPDGKQWYSAALENKPDNNEYSLSTQLVLYKYQGGDWAEVSRVAAPGGRSVAAEQIRDSVYLVVAQYLEDEALGNTVWRLSRDTSNLQFVHMLNTRLASHVIMWTDTYTAYTAIAVAENPAGSKERYSTRSPVYRWLGDSFDMIDSLPTYNPRAMVQFNIRSSIFVAVANFQNDYGETMIDSEIFRYDLTTGKFNLYQKLPTEAAVDIKSFCFQSNQITETFLVYASEFHTDERGIRDYNSPSVVYKLSDEEYFVPFQALHVSKVISWLPVKHIKDGIESLTLIGASDEGIISFQYDGWRFVPTGLQYDSSSFGLGPKSLNVFYSDDQAFISVANRHNTGYDMNIYSPVFTNYTGVEKLQRVISEWVKEMTQELIDVESNMIELTRIAREAPSVNDSIVEIGSYVVFRNAEIEKLETIATKVGDSSSDAEVYSQLIRLKAQLDSLNQSLAKLPSRIDQTSIFTYSVYEDVSSESIDISCTNPCDVQQLEVVDVNGENLSKFLKNTVKINEDVEFQDEIHFKELALIEPLDTKMINGHVTEELIDWSKEVVIDHKLQVEGDVIAKDYILVSGPVDGVFLNDIRKEDILESEVIVLPTRDLKSLNTSELMLSDGKLSGVDLRNFVLSTLKTEGDQSFSEFQDFERLEAEEVAAEDMFKAVSPLSSLSQQKACEEEDCIQQDYSPAFSARARSKNIESINYIDDVIIIPRNFAIYGTVVVENGSLTAKDLVDVKHNVSADKLSQFSIPLNQSIMTQHFKFKQEFKTPMLNVDMLNSLPLESMVELQEDRDVKLNGKKTFYGELTVDGSLNVTETINGHEKHNEIDLEHVELDYLDVNRINSRNVSFGPNKWEKWVIMRNDGSVIFKTLNVEGDVSANHTMVRGKINNYQLEELLSDSVFQGDDDLLISGTKHFIGESEIKNLMVNLSINNNLKIDSPDIIWKKRLMQAKSVEIDQLFYTGKLDGVESSDFGRWLLTEGDQNIAASQSLSRLQALNVMMSPSATLNSRNISHLLSQAVLTSDNATFEKLVFEESVSSSKVEVGGRMSGLEIPADVVLADPATDQLITGHKRMLQSVKSSGDLHISGIVSNVNITAYCHIFDSDDSDLIISGDGKFKNEPEILTSVNGNEWINITKNIWFKEDDLKVLEKVSMNEVDFDKLIVKNINSNNVEEQLSRLVSLSRDQNITGTIYFQDVVAEQGLRADEAAVGGDVQGIHLPSFVRNVLLNNDPQEIEGYLDFKRLSIQNGFEHLGLVNGLNISSDVMLANVASNTVTAELTLDELYVRKLTLPSGSLVGGVDTEKWNKTAVIKSGPEHVIIGNITILGQLDSGQGIRVGQLVNGVPFNKKNIMLSSGVQEIKGKKTFSSESTLTINELEVEGSFYHMDINDFYRQQVTANDDVTISAPTQFTAPLWSERVVLPEIYQGHNLSWLDYQLSAPLPWSSYEHQLANIHQADQLASRCLASSAFYLKNMTRMQDLEGDLLFTLPLKSGNVASVLSVVRRDNSQEGKITLAQLSWSDEQNTFVDMQGSDNYFLRVAPFEVQPITLPGGELAAYVTGYLPSKETTPVGQGFLLRLNNSLITQTKVLGGKPGSFLLSFLGYRQRTCFVVVADQCKVFCLKDAQRAVRLSSFSCYNVTKAALLSTERGCYIVGIQTHPQGSLFLWRLSGRKFHLVSQLPQFNPVSIAATTTTGPHVAVANQHQLGSLEPEVVNVYKLDEDVSLLRLQHRLPVDSPSHLAFSPLPSAESALFVASLLPSSPLQVFVYRGVLGYQPLTSDPSLPTPSDLQPFTDHRQRFFLIIPSNHTASVLMGVFEGKG